MAPPKKDNLAENGSRERVLRHEFAHRTAKLIRQAMELQEDAVKLARVKVSPEYEAARIQAVRAWGIFGQHFWLFSDGDNPGRFLRLVADALDGKLHGARYDDAIIKAYKKASRTGKRQAERTLNILPFFSEVRNALLIQSGRSPVPTGRALRRRLEILGYPLSKKAGRPRKKR